MFEQLESAALPHSGLMWRLRVWGIHQIGSDRWVQLSASDQLHQHDLIVHLGPDARASDVVAALGSWLSSAIPDSRVIHVL